MNVERIIVDLCMFDVLMGKQYFNMTQQYDFTIETAIKLRATACYAVAINEQRCCQRAAWAGKPPPV